MIDTYLNKIICADCLPTMREMPKTQIERQDLIDNAIFELLQMLNPTEKDIDWNIEMIGEVRDAVQSVMVDKLELCSEMNFYPFIEE